jgi:ribosomal protein S18 acetylase RimI-like enzyme
MSLITFRPLTEDREAERWVPEALPWVHEAGNPYYDWFFGGRERALTMLRDWMRRTSSEVFVGRSVLLVESGRPAGGFIALGGDELQHCRRADAVAAMEAAGREGRGRLLARMREAHELFAPVPADVFYLSKMGVVTAARGAGRGGRLVREYLSTGTALGFRRFCLDVCAGNTAAVRLYRAAGFRVGRTGCSDEAAMTYLRMNLELNNAWQDSRNDRADGGKTASGSQRQDGVSNSTGGEACASGSSGADIGDRSTSGCSSS